MGKKVVKYAKVEIVDSKGGKFRVKSVGKNGEVLQTSEVLESVTAVSKNVEAMKDCWGCNGLEIVVRDMTKEGKPSKKFKSWAPDAELPLRLTSQAISKATKDFENAMDDYAKASKL